MRTLLTAPVILSLLLLIGCSKKDSSSSVTPVTTTTAAVKADSVQQLPLAMPFIAHTDTFYGAVYENDWSAPGPDNYVTQIHVYVRYKSPTEILFSSDQYNSQVLMGTVSYYGDFPVNDSNSYKHVWDNTSWQWFRLRGDSIYYSGAAEACPDVDNIFFAGKKTSSIKSGR